MSSKYFANFSGRFPLLDTLARVLCFLVFPLIFVNYGLENLVENQSRHRREELFNKIEAKLDLVEFYADNGRFAHHILKQAFDRSEKSESDHELQMGREIQAIKQAYPDDFTFVVADKDGNILPQISDEQSYRYLYRQAFFLLQDVLSSVQSRYPGYPELVEDIDVRLGRLRSLVGPFIELSALVRPFLAGRTASAYLASPLNERFYVWYQTGGHLNVVVFISRRFINGNAGARWIVDKLNREVSDVSFGYAHYPFDTNAIYPQMSDGQSANSLIALGLFENIHPREFARVNNWYYACQPISERARAFAFLPVDMVKTGAEVKASFMAILAKVVFILLFIVGIAYYTGRMKYGLRLKLAGLFLYAALLPGVVVAMFLLREAEAKEQDLVYEEQTKNLKLLQNIDDLFPAYLESLEKKIAARLDAVEAAGLTSFANDKGLARLNAELSEVYGVQAIFAVDGYQKDFVDHSKSEIAVSPELLNAIGRDVVRVYSSVDLFNELNVYTDLARASTNTVHSFYALENKVRYLGMADSEYYTLMRLLRFEGASNDMVVMILFWSLDELQQLFLNEVSVRHSARDNRRQLILMNSLTERIVFPDDVAQNTHVHAALESLHRRQYFQSDKIEGLFGEEGVLVALRGIHLSRFNLAAFSSRAPLHRQSLRLRNRAMFFIALLIVIAGFSFYQLNKSLMSPLGTLKAGISALETRSFRHRIPISGENELGRLAQAFNRSLENLQELEVATIVQESLLPDSRTIQNGLELLCYTRSMTSLDGDFYEVIQPDSDKLFVFIGDSTGHGVPASLNMAMAKAVAVLAADNGFETEGFLLQLNEVFYNLRKSGSKDYMTGQCALFDSTSGEFTFYNAGHCFPMVIKSGGSDARFISHGGLPLGFSLKFRLNSLHEKLDQGDTVLFYSDGIVESVSDSGIPFGFDRLQQLATKAWNEDSEVYLNNMLAAVDAWASSQQDDYTIILCRRKI